MNVVKWNRWQSANPGDPGPNQPNYTNLFFLTKRNLYIKTCNDKKKTYINYVVKIYFKKHIKMEIRNDLSCFLSSKDDGCMCYHINRKALLNLLKDRIYAAHQMNVTFTLFCAKCILCSLMQNVFKKHNKWHAVCVKTSLILAKQNKYHRKSFCPGYFVSMHKYLKSFVQLHYNSYRILSKCVNFYKVKIIWGTVYLVNSV